MIVIQTPDEILVRGLELVGIDRDRQKRFKQSIKLEHFRSHFGSDPVVYADIWEDLQTTNLPAAIMILKHSDVDSFLMTLHFLKRYPTEIELATRFNMNERTVREIIWKFARKLQALKTQKVCSVDLFLNPFFAHYLPNNLPPVLDCVA